MNDSALISVLESLLRQPREQATVEFKSNWELPQDIGQYISALANAAALNGHDRAWMVWGVSNATHAVTGTTFDPFAYKFKEGANQSLTMWLQVMTSPRADFCFHEVNYQQLVLDYLKKYGKATRADLDALVIAKLPDVLDGPQRTNKVKNLIQGMRRAQLIELRGKRPALFWHLVSTTDKATLNGA